MKKTIILTLLCIFATIASLSAQTHSISFKTTSGDRFYMYMDGVLQNKKACQTLTVTNVPKGIHQLTVIINRKKQPQSFHQIRVNDKDLFFDIDVIGDDHSQFVIKFKPTAPFNFPVEFIKPYNTNSNTTFVAPPVPQGQQHPQGHGPQQPGHQPQGHCPNHQPDQQHCDGHHNHANGHADAPQIIVVEEGPRPCSATDLMNLKQAISKQNFSSDKMKVAKQAIPGLNLSAMQIKDIAMMFTFDSDRLELLKYAYGYCIDPQNYYTVYEVLTYSSSKDELDKLISGARY